MSTQNYPGAPARHFTLSSTSRYRKRQLENQFAIPIVTLPPNTEEGVLQGESAMETAIRLSEAKVKAAIGHADPQCPIIGGDQTAEFEGRQLSKPETPQKAVEQLCRFSGKSLSFYSGVCVIRPQDLVLRSAVTITEVKFRKLERVEIETYVGIEQPLDCLGAFKNEGLGILLFDEIKSSDPSALTGLPLIALNKILRDLGFNVLDMLQKQNAPPDIGP